MQSDTTAKETSAVCHQDALHCSAITLPYAFSTDMRLQLLQCPEEPERSVGSNLSRSRACKVAITHIRNHCIQNGEAVLLIALLQGQARQSDKGRAAGNTIPRISGNKLSAVTRTADDKLASRVLQAAAEVNLMCTTSDRCVEQLYDILR